MTSLALDWYSYYRIVILSFLTLLFTFFLGRSMLSIDSEIDLEKILIYMFLLCVIVLGVIHILEIKSINVIDDKIKANVLFFFNVLDLKLQDITGYFVLYEKTAYGQIPIYYLLANEYVVLRISGFNYDENIADWLTNLGIEEVKKVRLGLLDTLLLMSGIKRKMKQKKSTINRSKR